MHSKTVFFILQSIVVFIPASLILYYALNSGFLPDNDYWGFISHIISEQKGFSNNLYDWIQRDNEHYIFLPKLVYALNILVSGGNNVGLGLFAWFMALGLVIVLRQIIPVRENQHPIFFLTLLGVIAVFVFSPKQAHNWILGMSGVAWISANLLSISAILMLFRYAKNQKITGFIALIVLSLAAVATYSTSLAVLPTLIIAAFLLKLNRRDQILIVLFAIGLLGFYYTAYTTPVDHPSLQGSLGNLVYYFFAFIGALFSNELNIALIMGIVGLVSSFFILIYLYLKKQSLYISLLPWFIIQIYVCGNAAMAAIARSGFGLNQVFASRYGSLPALFWLAWIVIVFSLCLQQKQNIRKFSLVVLFFISSIMVVAMHIIGHNTAKPLLERAEKKSLTLAALYSQAYDLNLIHKTILPNVPFVAMERLNRRLMANQHIPFNGYFKDCPKMYSQFTPEIIATSPKQRGYFDEVKLQNNRIIKLKGWAYNDNKPPVCLVITNQDNQVKGVANYGLSRPDVAKAVTEVSSNDTGWQAYVKMNKKDKTLKVYMLTSKNQGVLLEGEHSVDELLANLFKDCPKKGNQLSNIHPAVHEKYFGHFDSLKENNNAIEVRGWAYNNNQKPACLVVTNQNNIVRAIIGSYGFTRSDVQKAIPSILSADIGWQGYGKTDKHDKILKVYLLIDNKKGWVPLNGQHSLNH